METKRYMPDWQDVAGWAKRFAYHQSARFRSLDHEDILQEAALVFSKILATPPKDPPKDKSGFLTLFRYSCYNRVLDLGRRQGRRIDPGPLPEDPDTMAALAATATAPEHLGPLARLEQPATFDEVFAAAAQVPNAKNGHPYLGTPKRQRQRELVEKMLSV